MRKNTTKQGKQRIAVTLEQLSELGRVFAKQCEFDHAHIPLVAHRILVVGEDGVTRLKIL